MTTEDETEAELEPDADDETLEPDALMALFIVGALAGKPLATFAVDNTERTYTAWKDPAWTGGAIFSLAQLYLRAATPAADVSVGDVAELSMRAVGAVSKVLEGWPRLEAGPPVAQDDSLSSLRLMGLSIADMVAVVDGVSGANAILAAVLEALGADSEVVGIARGAGKGWLLWHRKEDGNHIDLTTHQSWAVKAVLRATWARILAERERARLEADAREERRRKVPVPSLHGVTARVVAGLGRRLDTPDLRGKAAGIVAPFEPERWLQIDETAGDTAGLLAAWLAMVHHSQWLAGGHAMADRVEVVASKAQLEKMGLSGDKGSPAKTLEDALAVLASVRLMGGDDDKQPGSGRLVLDYFAAEPRTSEKGGRPSLVYVVTLGWPLMPQRLEALAEERGFIVPREFAWYGPVLNPAWAPLTGYSKTHRTQRLAYAVGAGQWLVSRREEYAERRGVRLDTLRAFLRGLGLYHRSHQSLADEVADLWRLPVKQQLLPTLGPTAPLLVETKVAGVYRLGPDYEAQEALVLQNAEVTANAKARQAFQKKKGQGKGKR